MIIGIAVLVGVVLLRRRSRSNRPDTDFTTGNPPSSKSDDGI
ncbi:hypothetical protein [Nocardia inohanensis]|nr:hypothetical protein [Nocardia inohanensis]